MESSFAPAMGALVIGIAVFVGVFLAMRAVWLWYWRVNRVVELLESIDYRLARLGTPTAAPAVRGGDYAPPAPHLASQRRWR